MRHPIGLPLDLPYGQGRSHGHSMGTMGLPFDVPCDVHWESRGNRMSNEISTGTSHRTSRGMGMRSSRGTSMRLPKECVVVTMVNHWNFRGGVPWKSADPHWVRCPEKQPLFPRVPSGRRLLEDYGGNISTSPPALEVLKKVSWRTSKPYKLSRVPQEAVVMGTWTASTLTNPRSTKRCSGFGMSAWSPSR